MDDYKHEIALSCRDMGNLQRMTGKIAEAVASYQAAIEIHEKLAADYPTNLTCRLNLANDLVPCGEALAMLGKWDESADVYAKAVPASNFAWQTMWPCALMQLASGNEEGYRAMCTNLVRRHGSNVVPDAAFPIAFTLIAGKKSLEDMNQPLLLAEHLAKSNPSNPIAKVLLGAAQYRAGLGKDAIATLTEALPQLETATPEGAKDPNQVFVCRVMGHVILILAYHDQANREALKKELKTLRELTDEPETVEQQSRGGLPPWVPSFATEIAKRELARLRAPAETSK